MLFAIEYIAQPAHVAHLRSHKKEPLPSGGLFPLVLYRILRELHSEGEDPLAHVILLDLSLMEKIFELPMSNLADSGTCFLLGLMSGLLFDLLLSRLGGLLKVRSC